MSYDKNELLNNLDKLHTTSLGIERIKKNLDIAEVNDVVEYCRNKAIKADNIERKGKNWYVSDNESVITINAYSYTIITAHKNKK